MHLQQVDKFVLFIFCFIGVIQVLVSTSSLNDRDDDSDADYYYGNQDSSNGDVENLLRQYPENREMIRNIGGQYEVIYPIRIKRRDKGGISTREVSPIKVGRHLHRTSLLIKAFKYRFRVDLEINMELISPEFMQKHLLPSGAAQVAKQEVEHCFYHGTVRDMPGAAGAFYTCDGIAGVIHIGNETFIIHPFYGSDLQKPPHIIYTDQEKQHSGCGNTGKFAYRNLIPKNSKGSKYSGSGYRDKREQFYKQKMKYIEIAIIIDRNMFLRRNETSSTVVVQDALQIANLADLYFRTMNTRISVKYVETWQGSNQIEILPNREIHEVLESLKLYASQKLSNLNRDTLHLLSGMVFRGTPAGISLPESVCRTDSVSITSEMNPYEPHISASIMAHMVGHVIGLPHDPPVGEIYDEGGPDQCACGDWHGCVMNDRIVGVSKVLPFKFSRCSIHDVVKTLKNGRAVCLMNKPTEVVSVYPRRCGNKITEDNEQCDCGPAETCEQVDPCCDAKTCKLKVDADCSSTLPCCSNCKILPKGNICRSASNECDLPEMCTGTSAECPRNIYRQDGVPCAANTSRCYSGFCPTLERQCEYYWGTGVQAAHNSCYETFNVRGNSLGNCGRLNSQVYVSCSIEDALCGTLQCTNGDHFPLMRAKTETSRNIITFQGEEHECKSIRAGLGTSTLKVGLIRDGTPCGTNKICVNQTCVNSRPLLDYHPRCPSRIRNVECSGTGYCTNLNHCFCVDGWTGIDCSEQIYTTPSPTTSTLPDEESEEGEEEGEEEDEEEGGVTQIITEITNVSLIVETKHSYKNQMEGKETHYGGQKDTVSTFSLVFVLTAAVKSVFVGFALLAICCRYCSNKRKIFIDMRGILIPLKVSKLYYYLVILYNDLCVPEFC